ncbi:thymidine kinase [Helcococcus massiliensis]|uniref:thymidine kinase n=1 Tax=Helcococcus massiliensis TaxID=2040290 RepID=UPI000CDEFC13|nr:thymidine kinase [Helcococcus massiliensis]
MAKLYFRYGAMNSGKSTALMQVAYNYEERGMKVRILKPKIDSKGDDKLVSRLGVTRKVDYLIDEEDNLFDSFSKIENGERISCILVDESQFLSADQIDQLLNIAVIKDVPVICYGLRTDFKTQGFSGSQRLLLVAHSLEELKTICRCGKKAIFNGRKINGIFVFEGDQISIDNNDKVDYEAMCANCYFKRMEEEKERLGGSQLSF